MAATYTLIASNVLTTTTASVTFSAIPSTYTDLVVRTSARSTFTDTSVTVAFDSPSAVFSGTTLQGSGSAAISGRFTANGQGIAGSIDISTQTASTFASSEMYIPNYRSTVNKPFAEFGVQENNATASDITSVANLYSSALPITTMTFYAGGGSFVAGSSFYLYGIKNS